MSIRTTIKIYHSGNGSSDKVEKIKALAKDINVETITFNILEDRFTATRLLQICNKMNVRLKDIVNDKNEFYQKNLANANFDEADWVRILIEKPELIKVPIVETDSKAKIIDNPRDILNFPSVGQNINGYNHEEN